ncbi:L,D-transpeptidase [Corynebacterium uterequi]|uniref:L,D-TPase catalytic domain-containing protein n=1 Tax=Corynebacterium uterequi TaxID=1072256 RepID=A0A0G3HIH6_9CORY|nr:hypothetical protein CUTER_08735 [Corynebacterium uterequi]
MGLTRKNWVKVAAASTLLAVAGGTLTACSIDGVGATPDSDAVAEEAKPVLTWNVKDGAKEYNPAEPVTLSVVDGTIIRAEMVNEEDKVVEAKLSSDGTEWTTTEPLGFYRTYTLTVETSDGAKETRTFSTVEPAGTSALGLGPVAGSTVGVAKTIDFYFGSAVTNKDAVEEAITIETSNDTVGDFIWLDDLTLRWRPKEFWQSGTEVSVDADLYGLEISDGVFVDDDYSTNFTIGEDVRAEVDDATKTMKVFRNGELLREIPVSLGRDNSTWATPNGIYVVGNENTSMIMDSTTFGLAYDQGGYRTPVQYATQLSYSGIYVHGAPWSVWAQGSQNTSHGCVNVSIEDAAWFQEVVKLGDPVTVKNTVGGTLPGYDGLGQWNLTWEQIQNNDVGL